MHRFESGYGDNGAKFRQQSLGWQQILITLTGTLRPATFGMFFAAAGMACFALYIWTDVNVFGILFAVSMVACVASFAWSLKLWFWPNPLRQLPDWLR